MQLHCAVTDTAAASQLLQLLNAMDENAEQVHVITVQSGESIGDHGDTTCSQVYNENPSEAPNEASVTEVSSNSATSGQPLYRIMYTIELFSLNVGYIYI